MKLKEWKRKKEVCHSKLLYIYIYITYKSIYEFPYLFIDLTWFPCRFLLDKNSMESFNINDDK